MISAALDPDERSRYEIEGETTLILLRVPVTNRGEDSEYPVRKGIPYITLPVGIVVTPEAIITVTSYRLSMLADFVEGRVKSFNPANPLRFVLQIFYSSALRYLRYLKEIEIQTTEIERRLQLSQKNRELISLLNYEKSLVYFSTSLRANHIMMERLRRTPFLRRALAEEKELLEDIIIDNTQALEMANIYTNILSGLMDAFASVISNNVNSVMKSLTKVTIVLMIPTLISSFYGMNIELPFADSPFAFLYIVGLSAAISVLTIWLFTGGRLR
jgi:magnesium transporter